MVEDCEEAFVKNPDGHPLVLYLKTGTDHSLTGPTRQLLERVNLADKASKIKVCCVIFHLPRSFIVNAPHASAFTLFMFLRSQHKITTQYNHSLNDIFCAFLVARCHTLLVLKCFKHYLRWWITGVLQRWGLSWFAVS